MTRCIGLLHHVWYLTGTLLTLLVDVAHLLRLCWRLSAVLAAENLFLRKQLACYQERQVKPRRATDAARLALVWLGRWFDWRQALTIVQSATFIRWHRQGFRFFWRWKSTPGRPPIPADLQALIRRMARENPTWGQERIANELLLKLGLRVSPRTVRKYMPTPVDRKPGQRVSSQRWMTFVRNHAQAIVACDFCVVVTATFRLLYVFVVMEHATRRILHMNVTRHPTAPWTLQQLREAIPADHAYRFLLHDRDSIFSQQLDQSIRHLGLRVLKTPVRTPPGQCPVRAAHRHPTARVCGLSDSTHCRPSPASSDSMDAALQCKSSAYVAGTWHTAAAPVFASASPSASASSARASAGGRASDSRWITPRLCARKAGSVRIKSWMRTTRTAGWATTERGGGPDERAPCRSLG